MEKVYIYGLIDPITNGLRYVGKSINPNSRYRKHLQDSKKKITYKDKWIFMLLEKNIKPELLIIDEIINEDWTFWEIHYISYFKSIGSKLCNLTNGGENPPNHQQGKKRTIEEIKKITIGNLGKKRSLETRNNISKAKKGKPIPHLNNEKERSLSHRKNLSLSLKGRTSPNKGLIFSEERKKSLSEGHNKEKRKIVQLTKSGEYIKTWFGINETEKQLKIRHISECCGGKCKTAGGFKWVYYEKYGKYRK
jgi:hypothetical protein